jgi:hypothetical protein
LGAATAETMVKPAKAMERRVVGIADMVGGVFVVKA